MIPCFRFINVVKNILIRIDVPELTDIKLPEIPVLPDLDLTLDIPEPPVFVEPIPTELVKIEDTEPSVTPKEPISVGTSLLIRYLIFMGEQRASGPSNQ